jgi:hypothetical protein
MLTACKALRLLDFRTRTSWLTNADLAELSQLPVETLTLSPTNRITASAVEDLKRVWKRDVTLKLM